MAQIFIPEKKDELNQSLGSIGSLVGGAIGGPPGAMIGGMLGDTAASQENPQMAAVGRALQKKQAPKQLEMGLASLQSMPPEVKQDLEPIFQSAYKRYQQNYV